MPDTAPQPSTELPRERLWALGAGALTSGELLAILLGTGGPGVGALEVSGQLLEVSGGSLRRLAARPPAELQQAAGVGPAKAGRLLAAFEIANRLMAESRPAALRIREPEDVVRMLAARLRDLIGDELVGPEYENLVELFAEARPEIMRSGRSFRERRALWYRLVDGPALGLIRDGDPDGARRAVETEIARWEAQAA